MTPHPSKSVLLPLRDPSWFIYLQMLFPEVNKGVSSLHLSNFGTDKLVGLILRVFYFTHTAQHASSETDHSVARKNLPLY